MQLVDFAKLQQNNRAELDQVFHAFKSSHSCLCVFAQISSVCRRAVACLRLWTEISTSPTSSRRTPGATTSATLASRTRRPSSRSSPSPSACSTVSLCVCVNERYWCSSVSKTPKRPFIVLTLRPLALMNNESCWVANAGCETLRKLLHVFDLCCCFVVFQWIHSMTQWQIISMTLICLVVSDGAP